MEIFVTIVILALTLIVVRFLFRGRCLHSWVTADDLSEGVGKTKCFMQRCRKCGTVRLKKVKPEEETTSPDQEDDDD